MTDKPKGWKETTLGEVAEINPTESLSKGKIAKYVAMENISPFTRQISKFAMKAYNGGMKFRNGDTLLARITPCLENGKTSYVNFLNHDEVGFGSTEFIVIREKEDLSDEKFLYYLAISPRFREIAIKSMTGTSGRQRVQIDLLVGENQILFPPLPEQCAIAVVLSSLDDKIELLREQNKTMEATAQAIFKEWFAAPSESLAKEGELPKRWRMGKLGDILELAYGKGLKEEKREGKDYPVIGSSGIVGYHKDYLVSGPGIVVGRKGTTGTVIWIDEDFYPIDTTFYVKDKLGVSDLYFHYFILKQQDFIKIGSDSAVPGLNRNSAYSIELTLPDIQAVKNLNDLVKPLFKKRKNNNSQIQTLSKLRDTLLPKLMSGKLRVKHY